MFNVYTYNPADVYLIVAGYICTGWNKITISRSSPTFKIIKGINGKNTRVQTDDTSATITLDCMQLSDTNDIFSQIHALDIENGGARLDIMLVDKSGTSVYRSEEGFIEGYPQATYADSIGYTSWTIHCLSMDEYVVGGNIQPDNDVINQVLSLI